MSLRTKSASSVRDCVGMKKSDGTRSVVPYVIKAGLTLLFSLIDVR